MVDGYLATHRLEDRLIERSDRGMPVLGFFEAFDPWEKLGAVGHLRYVHEIKRVFCPEVPPGYLYIFLKVRSLA